MSTEERNFEVRREEDNRVIDKFIQFLKIRSVSAEGPKGSYNAALQFLLDYAKEVGIEHHKIFYYAENQPILLLTWKGTDPSLKSILLNGHYDVVPADPTKWKYDPWAGTRTSNGNIYGRGAQDMKSVVMQHLEAVGRLMKDVKEGKIPPPKRTIHISILPDEETGGTFGAGPFVKSDIFKGLNVGVTLDEGLASPNDSFSIFYGERAAWFVKIKAEGPTGHGSRFIPRAAIEKLSSVLQKAYAFRSEQEAKLNDCDSNACNHSHTKLGDVVTLNVTALKSFVPGPPNFDGFAVNCIPTEAIAALDVRIPPHIPLKHIEDLFKQWTSEEGLSYSFYLKTPEHITSNTNQDDPWWSTIQGVFEKLGISIRPEIFSASPDARYYRSVGVPCYGFTPLRRTPILLHDVDEFVNERELLEGVGVFQQLIYQLANNKKAKL